MKKQLHVKKPVALVFVWICSFFLLSGCATRAKFVSSPVVPAAQGQVKVKKDNNNNYRLSIDVENLAEPKQLPQPRNVYVVWADTPNGVQNLGQLKVDKGFLSGKLKASLETLTPYKPSRVFITAEDVATVSYPGSYTVLNTNSF